MNWVYAFNRHVQINNDGAIEFYKKFGFEIVDTKEQYYKRIEPADAHVLQKALRRKKSDIHNHAFTNGAVNDKKDRRTWKRPSWNWNNNMRHTDNRKRPVFSNNL